MGATSTRRRFAAGRNGAQLNMSHMSESVSKHDRSTSGRNATADRAVEILLLFDDDHPTLAAGDVAARLAMSRSTTYRYLQSLRTSGFLEEEDGSGRYRLGPQVLRLARVARKGIGVAEAALPVMQALAAATGEDVLLTRRSGSQVACIERVPGRHLVRLSYERGHLLPCHAGASALAALAFAPSDEIERVLSSAPLERFTERTPTDADAVRAKLAAIRADGFSVTEGEVDPGVRGIAAPVFRPDGRVVAAISVVGLSFRLTDEVVGQVVLAVRQAAQAVTDRLAELD